MIAINQSPSGLDASHPSGRHEHLQRVCPVASVHWSRSDNGTKGFWFAIFSFVSWKIKPDATTSASCVARGCVSKLSIVTCDLTLRLGPDEGWWEPLEMVSTLFLAYPARDSPTNDSKTTMAPQASAALLLDAASSKASTESALSLCFHSTSNLALFNWTSLHFETLAPRMLGVSCPEPDSMSTWQRRAWPPAV